MHDLPCEMIVRRRTLAVDGQGQVYVVDQLFNKVEAIRRVSEADGEKILRAAK